MTRQKKEPTVPTGIGTLTITIPHAEGGSTLKRLQWFLDQINNGDVIDDITVSGGTLHGVMLHNEEIGMIGEWQYTEIGYDLKNDGKRVTPTPALRIKAHEIWLDHTKNCSRCRGATRMGGHVVTHEMCSQGTPLYITWQDLKNA